MAELETKIRENVQPIIYRKQSKEFDGEGWKYIIDKINSSQNVLIGEDHFTNEIPALVDEIVKIDSFDNCHIEVDRYSTNIIKKSLTLPENERISFNREYQDLFSFYSLQPEYELLSNISELGINILGNDQVLMYADRLIFDYLSKETSNEEVKNIYHEISNRSQEQFEKFMEEMNFNLFYFMTPSFSDKLDQLEQLPITTEESQIIEDIRRSISIYKQQSHNERVKLLINGLMRDYDMWKNKKNLFKYGANHMMRGESLLYVHDIGNVITNITKGYWQQSFHLMVVGMDGELGTPFRGMQPNEVDMEKNIYLKPLIPILEILREHSDISVDNNSDDTWYLIDFIPLRRLLLRDELEIKDKNLIRCIKGYDALVVIPKVTPAAFTERE